MNKRMIIMLGVLVAALGGWYFTQGQSSTHEGPLPAVEPPPVTPPHPVPDAAAPVKPNDPAAANAAPVAAPAPVTPAAPQTAAAAPGSAPEANPQAVAAVATPPVAEAAATVEAANAAQAATAAALDADQPAAAPGAEAAPSEAAAAVVTPEAPAQPVADANPVAPVATPEKPAEPAKEAEPAPKKKAKGKWASLSPEEREGKHDLNKPVDEKEWKEITRSVASVDVTSEEGETMVEVAKRVYGDSNLWPKLWSLNPQVGNPYTMKVGTHLKVK